ncbi:MAG: hypothetical protein O2923_14265 [Verrucomicrobia bacterium]|nr:hypothetical protein [Verrucomicrobiota bacterium]MDA1088391.1 hypothetical protein [Verrucomicrobiota bacterium]
MTADSRIQQNSRRRSQVVVSVAVVVVGVTGCIGLALMKRSPPQTPPAERAIPVTGYVVNPQHHAMVLTGYGVAKAQRRVRIAAEVSGLVTDVHHSLISVPILPYVTKEVILSMAGFA